MKFTPIQGDFYHFEVGYLFICQLIVYIFLQGFLYLYFRYPSRVFSIHIVQISLQGFLYIYSFQISPQGFLYIYIVQISLQGFLCPLNSVMVSMKTKPERISGKKKKFVSFLLFQMFSNILVLEIKIKLQKKFSTK